MLNDNNLTIDERAAGILLQNRVKKFYSVTDTQISEANWFTRLLSALQEFSFFRTTRDLIEANYLPLRHEYEDDPNWHFRGYTRTLYNRDFNHQITEEQWQSGQFPSFKDYVSFGHSADGSPEKNADGSDTNMMLVDKIVILKKSFPDLRPDILASLVD